MCSCNVVNWRSLSRLNWYKERAEHFQRMTHCCSEGPRSRTESYIYPENHKCVESQDIWNLSWTLQFPSLRRLTYKYRRHFSTRGSCESQKWLTSSCKEDETFPFPPQMFSYHTLYIKLEVRTRFFNLNAWSIIPTGVFSRFGPLLYPLGVCVCVWSNDSHYASCGTIPSECLFPLPLDQGTGQ